MDGKIMDVIKNEVRKLPPRGKNRDKQYVAGKQILLPLFPGKEELVCKELAKKYKV